MTLKPDPNFKRRKQPAQRQAKPAHEDPSVNAARLGWTEHPTMTGPHWLYWDGKMEIVHVSALLGDDKHTVLLYPEPDDPMKRTCHTARWLKIVTPQPPQERQ